MSVTVTLDFKAKPDNAQKLYDTLAAILGDTRAFEGNEGVTVHRDLSDETLIFLYEHWTAIENQQAYMNWRQERGDLDTLVSMLAEPPVIRSWENSPI